MTKRKTIVPISATATTSSVIVGGNHYTEEEFARFEKIANERDISIDEAIKTQAVAAPRKRKSAPRTPSTTPARWR